MVKLPPALKQLLSLRNPSLAPVPALNSVLRSTLSDAKKRNVEDAWLVLTTCTLVTANRPTSVGHLYQLATTSNAGDAQTAYSLVSSVKTAALMRESALKSAVFIGVPRVILSLAGLMEVLEDDVKKDLRSESLRNANPENIELIKSRGRALWDSIYEPHAEKLHTKLGSYHPDFISFIIQSYGSVLAPLSGDLPGNLSRALTSVVGLTCLRAEGGVAPQFTSHVFGLLKARNEPGQNEQDKWLSSDEGAEWVVRTVDSVLDVIKPQDIHAKL